MKTIPITIADAAPMAAPMRMPTCWSGGTTFSRTVASASWRSQSTAVCIRSAMASMIGLRGIRCSDTPVALAPCSSDIGPPLLRKCPPTRISIPKRRPAGRLDARRPAGRVVRWCRGVGLLDDLVGHRVRTLKTKLVAEDRADVEDRRRVRSAVDTDADRLVAVVREAHAGTERPGLVGEEHDARVREVARVGREPDARGARGALPFALAAVAGDPDGPCCLGARAAAAPD